jgi:hypothetical protein
VWLAGTPTNTAYQRTQYYPSGVPWASNTGDNPSYLPYKYNNKEYVEMNGYDCTDLGWRWDYNSIFRFTSMDRKSEKYPWQSPYCVAANNPVRYNDKNGEGAGDPNAGGTPAVDTDKKKTTAQSSTAVKVPDKIKPIQTPPNFELKEAQKAEANKSKNQLVQGPSNLEKAIVLTPEEKAVMPATQTALGVVAIAPVATTIGTAVTSTTTVNFLINTAPITLPAVEGIIKALITAPPDAPSFFQNQPISDFFNGGTTLILDNRTTNKK